MNMLNLMCHRKPERSFQYKGHYFPVCARCTGFYIAIFTYGILAMIVPITYISNSIMIGILLLVPSGIDGITQLFELRTSNNILRLATGLFGGIGLMIILKTLKFMFIY